MKPERFIKELELMPGRLTAMVEDVGEEVARWRPGKGRWSILEVGAHLADDEREDFRTRVRLTLEQPATNWPPIDPERWVVERKYNERERDDMLSDFLHERAVSLEWLRGLDDADWTSTHTHPKLGSMSAYELLAAWAAHDLLHLRQIAHIRLAWLMRDAPPMAKQYAGG